MVSAIDSLKKGADSDRETEELEELEKQYSDYVDIYDKAVLLNNENEAMELINGEIKERGEKVSTYLESVNLYNWWNRNCWSIVGGITGTDGWLMMTDCWWLIADDWLLMFAVVGSLLYVRPQSD